MLKYEIFPNKEFPKETRQEQGEGERQRRLIDAMSFMCRHSRTDIDFYEIRNGQAGRRRPGGRSGGWDRGPEGQARLWVSPGDTVPSFWEPSPLKGKTRGMDTRDTSEPTKALSARGPVHPSEALGA